MGNSSSISSPNLNTTLRAGKLSSLKPLPKTSLAQVCNTVTYVYSVPYQCASGNHGPGDSGCALQGSDRAGYANISNTVTTCYDVYLPTGEGGGGGGGVTTPTPPPNYNPCDKLPLIDVYRGVRGERLAVAAGTPPCDLAPLPPAPLIVPIIIPLDIRLQYPTIAKIVDGLYEKVKNDPKLMAALKKYSNLSEQQILDNLKVGKGPTIVVKDLNGRTGHYDKNLNVIEIDTSVANDINYVRLGQATALEFYLTAIILHEFVHFGNNMTLDFYPNFGKFDAGFQFENQYYGGRVRFDNDIITFEKIPGL